MSESYPRSEDLPYSGGPDPNPDPNVHREGQAAEVLDSSDGYDVSGSGAGATAGGFGAMLLVGTVITACLFGFIYQLFAAAL